MNHQLSPEKVQEALFVIKWIIGLAIAMAIFFALIHRKSEPFEHKPFEYKDPEDRVQDI